MNRDRALNWLSENIKTWPVGRPSLSLPKPDEWDWSHCYSSTQERNVLILSYVGGRSEYLLISEDDWREYTVNIPNPDSKTSIMRYFEFEHLPQHLQQASESICLIARAYNDTLPDGPEKSAGLRKLLEAKDCFVRASL